MTPARGLLVLFAWSLFATDASTFRPVAAQESPPNAGSESPSYKAMPWHLVDLWWDLGEDRPFQSLAVDVKIEGTLPEGCRLYISPMGIAHLGDTPVYGGIQTQSDGHTRSDRKLRQLGSGLLMSRWNERDLAAARPSEGGFCQSSGHEGDFISVRRPYEWTPGTYTWRVVRMDEEMVGDEPHTWVGAFVHSHAKDEEIFVGALRFPGRDLVLKKSVANFVEVYGPAIPVDEIPDITVTFSAPVVNGQRLEKPEASAIYPEGVPDFAEAKREGDRIVVRVGEPVADRQQRRVELNAE